MGVRGRGGVRHVVGHVRFLWLSLRGHQEGQGPIMKAVAWLEPVSDPEPFCSTTDCVNLGEMRMVTLDGRDLGCWCMSHGFEALAIYRHMNRS